jgi:acyl-CoA synthetase (AMP-forming)/AMP-acid ligase II
MAGTGLGSCANLNKNDKLYVTLPIYHASGCSNGVGFAFLFGSTIG